MSTSYNNHAQPSIVDVEAFIYRDTPGSGPTTNDGVDSQGESPDAKPEKSSAPRINEEDIFTAIKGIYDVCQGGYACVAMIAGELHFGSLAWI